MPYWDWGNGKTDAELNAKYGEPKSLTEHIYEGIGEDLPDKLNRIEKDIRKILQILSKDDEDEQSEDH